MKRTSIFHKTALVCFLSFLCGLFLFSSSGKALAAEMECVSYTAYTSLYWLKEAGVPEAREFAGVVGKNVALDKSKIQDYEAIAPVNRLYHEMLYKSLNGYIESKNYTNIMDLACGFSPRALLMARQGKHYIGADLDAVAMSVSKCYGKSLSGHQKALASCEIVDATKLKDMLDASDQFHGSICITIDGLMMYLTKDEQAKVLKNIQKVLKKHGGVCITPDFSVRELMTGASHTLYGSADDQKIYRESMNIYESLAGANFDSSTLKSAAEAESFIKAQGLTVRRLPLLSPGTKLCSTGNFTPEQKTRLEALKKQPFLWVITAN